jgi:hypothetical protein
MIIRRIGYAVTDNQNRVWNGKKWVKDFDPKTCTITDPSKAYETAWVLRARYKNTKTKVSLRQVLYHREEKVAVTATETITLG